MLSRLIHCKNVFSSKILSRKRMFSFFDFLFSNLNTKVFFLYYKHVVYFLNNVIQIFKLQKIHFILTVEKNICTALQSNISFLENGGTKAFYSWITVKNINFTRDSIDTYKYVTRLKTSQN